MISHPASTQPSNALEGSRQADSAAYGLELVSGAGCVPTLRIARGPAAPSARRTSSTANAKMSGKLAAVMHVAVILQDCLAHYTVIVLMKPCASILSPNMVRMKVDMIMRMKVIVRRNWGAKENGEQPFL